MSGHLFVNQQAGAGEAAMGDLEAQLPGHVVEACAPELLSERVAAALDLGPAFIGVAGGDGTIRSVVEVVAGSATPLLVVPAGTRNHFAKDVGIADLAKAVEAARGMKTRTVDVGCVNDRLFVNNASIGSYPRLVRAREQRERRMPKRLAHLIAGWEQLRRGRRLRCEVDGASMLVWAVFVGNGRYGDTIATMVERDDLADGTLDVRIVRADRRWARLRVALDVLFGLGRSRVVEQRSVTELVVSTTHATAVALDGEVLTMESPLEFSLRPNGLLLLVPG